MNTGTALILLTLLTTSAFGQVDALKTGEPRITGTLIRDRPYYIIKADNKQIGFFSSLEFDTNPISTLKPKWIKTINIYKGNKATDEFGDMGLNGVILIELKKRKLKKLPEEIQRRFVLAETKT
ncbi:MAG TPA: hypothetical protein VFU05_01805 [Cyclobacteriaceae bacterium]|nr:hypothetical protein [Cyclobacteriaceae bacterium]